MIKSEQLVMGIDFGTSGVRISIIDKNKKVIYVSQTEYLQGIEYCKDWEDACKFLLYNIPKEIKRNLAACSVDGTSGTIIACNPNGEPQGKAIPYYLTFPELEEKFLTPKIQETCLKTNHSSLGRALKLLEENQDYIYIRHQADWILGWLIGDWSWGEAGNNIKMGWDLERNSWPHYYNKINLHKYLPRVVESGQVISQLDPLLANKLELPKDILVIAGTTDSNASVLSAEPQDNEGVTILGSTTVLKKFVEKPYFNQKLTTHKVNHRWLCGESSNVGGAILRKLFSDEDLEDLSKQINPELNSEVSIRALSFHDYKFPINNSEIFLEDRPISDCLYLHALLEALARSEAEGWQHLFSIGINPPKTLVTIGGGSRNPQWRRIRERTLGLSIRTAKTDAAYGVALIALSSILNFSSKPIIK